MPIGYLQPVAGLAASWSEDWRLSRSASSNTPKPPRATGAASDAHGSPLDLAKIPPTMSQNPRSASAAKRRGHPFPQERADEHHEEAAHDEAGPGIPETRDAEDGRADHDGRPERSDQDRGHRRPVGECPQRRALMVGHAVAAVSTDRCPEDPGDRDTVEAERHWLGRRRHPDRDHGAAGHIHQQADRTPRVHVRVPPRVKHHADPSGRAGSPTSCARDSCPSSLLDAGSDAHRIRRRAASDRASTGASRRGPRVTTTYHTLLPAW
jgi:hypothetical protein